jgi:hypothetical protein
VWTQCPGGADQKTKKKPMPTPDIKQGILVFLVFFGFSRDLLVFLEINDFLRKHFMEMLTIFQGQKTENWLIEKKLTKTSTKL